MLNPFKNTKKLEQSPSDEELIEQFKSGLRTWYFDEADRRAIEFLKAHPIPPEMLREKKHDRKNSGQVSFRLFGYQILTRKLSGR